MSGSGGVEVERKVNTILRVLSESDEAVGARLIGRELKKHGIDLSERAVRYHLKLMDERGLTQLMGRDGRQITPAGLEELRNALVADKVGLFMNRIEIVSFRTTFDWKTQSGCVPANLSLFAKDDFPRALKAMESAFKAGISVGDLVVVASLLLVALDMEEVLELLDKEIMVELEEAMVLLEEVEVVLPL